MVKSTVLPYINLANEIQLMESIHMLETSMIHITCREISKGGGYLAPEYYGIAELSSCTKIYSLNITEQTRLRASYATLLDCDMEELEELEFSGLQCSKYLSEQGHLFHSHKDSVKKSHLA